MKLTDKQKYELFRVCSGHFLTAKFPEDFTNWTEEELDQFILDHTWEPFEYHSPSDLYFLIESSCDRTIEAIEAMEIV